jgi:hypothetical protein
MEGGEVMTVLQVAMMGKLPYTVMRDGIFAHPAWAESLNNLFMSMDGQGLHGEKRSKCAVRGSTDGATSVC